MNWCGATASWGRLNAWGGDAYMVSFESTFKEMRVLTCHSKEMRVQNCHFFTFVFGDASAYLSLSVAITNWDWVTRWTRPTLVWTNWPLGETPCTHCIEKLKSNRDMSCPTQSRHILSNVIEACLVQCNRGPDHTCFGKCVSHYSMFFMNTFMYCCFHFIRRCELQMEGLC